MPCIYLYRFNFKIFSHIYGYLGYDILVQILMYIELSKELDRYRYVIIYIYVLFTWININC